MEKMGEIAVFIRNEDCAIDPLEGTITVKTCCTGESKEAKIEKGHGQVRGLLPGCYMVYVQTKRGLWMTLALIKCNETVCLNPAYPYLK